jgi:hypothetical protein
MLSTELFIMEHGAQKCTYNLENRRTMLIFFEKIIQCICRRVEQMEKSTYPIL